MIISPANANAGFGGVVWREVWLLPLLLLRCTCRRIETKLEHGAMGLAAGSPLQGEAADRTQTAAAGVRGSPAPSSQSHGSCREIEVKRKPLHTSGPQDTSRSSGSSPTGTTCRRQPGAGRPPHPHYRQVMGSMAGEEANGGLEGSSYERVPRGRCPPPIAPSPDPRRGEIMKSRHEEHSANRASRRHPSQVVMMSKGRGDVARTPMPKWKRGYVGFKRKVTPLAYPTALLDLP